MVAKTTPDRETFERLLGVWQVDSFIFLDETGIQPWRSGVHGTLVYECSGYMALSVNSALGDDHPYDSIFFYSGTFEVNGDEVIHRVRNASNPARIGKRLVRRVDWVGDRLSLSGSDAFGSGGMTFVRAIKG